MSTPKPAVPKVIDSRLIFEESIIRIQKDTLQLSNQEQHAYYILQTKPYAVVILATTIEGLYILNEEYRYPTKHFLLSCAGGYMDENEDPLKTARRELLEETGYEAEHYEIIGSAYPYAGVSTQKTIYVRAKGAKFQSKPSLDPTEVIRTILKTKEELYEMISQSNTLDASLCTALFFEMTYQYKKHEV